MDAVAEKPVKPGKRMPEPRRPKFNFAEEWRRRWCRNTIFYTMLMNAYTIMFPAVERYTVTTLRSVLDEITDPELKARTVAMVAQEALHAKQHEESFQVLENSRLDYRYMERFNAWVMALIPLLSKPLGKLGKYFMVAGVVGGEHWTTVIARWSLNSSSFRYFDGPMARLYLWHAVEEIEHKSVAFDVLQHIRPGYFLRVIGFLMSTLFFFFLNIATLIFLMGQMRVQEFLNPRFYLEILLFALIWPAALPKTLWGIIEFCLPGYHPDKHSDEEGFAYGMKLLKEAGLANE